MDMQNFWITSKQNPLWFISLINIVFYIFWFKTITAVSHGKGELKFCERDFSIILYRPWYVTVKLEIPIVTVHICLKNVYLSDFIPPLRKHSSRSKQLHSKISFKTRSLSIRVYSPKLRNVKQHRISAGIRTIKLPSWNKQPLRKFHSYLEVTNGSFKTHFIATTRTIINPYSTN